MKWKVCGMRDATNIEQVARLNPDFMGFIFYKNSSRYIEPEKLVSAMSEFPKNTKKVGVFVNESPDKIVFIAELLGLDYAQLHGNESRETIKSIVERGISVIKAFHIDGGFDWQQLTAYHGLVDFLLFDTKGANFGGNGRLFDWSLLDRYEGKTPYILSGGIGPIEVRDVLTIKDDRLVAVDVNSRVEEKPGFKNIKLLRQIKTVIDEI